MPSITVLRAFWRNTNLPPVVPVTTKKPCRLLGSATRGSLKILSVECPAVGFNIEEVSDRRHRRRVAHRSVPALTRMPLPFAGTAKGVWPVWPRARRMPRAWMPVRRASSPSGFRYPHLGVSPFLALVLHRVIGATQSGHEDAVVLIWHGSPKSSRLVAVRIRAFGFS